MKRLNFGRGALVLACVTTTLTGCQGMIYKTTGDVISGYSVDHILPDLMTSRDVDKACELGVSFEGFISSFARVTDSPDRASFVTALAAGMCSEAAAWEAELDQLKALRAGRAEDAQDARIREQRAHAAAAGRFLRAWEATQRAFPVSKGATCPRVEHEQDQVLFSLGLSAGVLAVMHDRAADGLAGVPMSIPPQVIALSSCVDSASLWGVPQALRASLFATVPGQTPAGADPLQLLDQASAQGASAGVRLSRAFQVVTLSTLGEAPALRAAVSSHAAESRAGGLDETWALLDAYATLMVQHEADKIWIGERGHRTPLGQLGQWPEADAPPEDDLLDGLDDLGADLSDESLTE